MPRYALLFDESVYSKMAKHDYNHNLYRRIRKIFKGQSKSLNVEHKDLVDEGQKLQVEREGFDSRHDLPADSKCLRHQITGQRRQRQLKRYCPPTELTTQVSTRSFPSSVFVSVALATINDDEENHSTGLDV